MIPHNLPSLGSEEQAAAEKVIRSRWVAQGPEVTAFENELCLYLGIPEGHALAVSSGSTALFLALWLLNGRGCRIGLPVYSCSSLRNAVRLIDGLPIYLDCAPGNPNLDIEKANEKKLDILIAPSIYGQPIQLDSCDGFYRIIEDIAQSLGAQIDGSPIGLRGDVGICSFSATKLITCGGQGGALASRNKSLIDRGRNFIDFDTPNGDNLKFNFQLTDLQAAIGRAQLRKLPGFLDRRQSIYTIYKESGLDLLDQTPLHGMAVRYRAIVRCKDPQYIIEQLALQGIRAIVPIEERELLDSSDGYPEAASLCMSTVSLPIYPLLSDESAQNIGSIVRDCK